MMVRRSLQQVRIALGHGPRERHYTSVSILPVPLVMLVIFSPLNGLAIAFRLY